MIDLIKTGKVSRLVSLFLMSTWANESWNQTLTKKDVFHKWQTRFMLWTRTDRSIAWGC